MKSLVSGLLVLLLGAAGGFYLSTKFPDVAVLKEKIPFLNSSEKEGTDQMEQAVDTTGTMASATACGEDEALHTKLISVSTSLEAMKLPYVASKGQDCSGIYHKIKDSIQQWLPEDCAENYVFPEYDQIRSSRQIADWYHEQGNLTLVEDPMAVRNQIKPGSVMFYSKPGQKYSNLTIEKLTAKSQNYSSSGAIMHIGTVVDVEKDENGNVIQYTLMHGRNEKYPASRTDFHKEVQSKNNPNLPAFGNWSQQWVAIADIATPKSGNEPANPDDSGE